LKVCIWKNKNRAETVHKLNDLYLTGEKVRKTQDVEIQTESSYITPMKIKDIVLPSLDDHQIMRGYEHPFSNVLKFLNQESIEFPKKLEFEPQPVTNIFITSEAILDRIGSELLANSQKCSDDLLQLGKRKKSPRGRPRSPKRRKKKGKTQDGLALDFLRTNQSYPHIETMYIQQL